MVDNIAKYIFYSDYLRCKVRNCFTCKLDKPLTEWYSLGWCRESSCKECCRVRQHKKRQSENYKKSRRIWLSNNKDKIIKYRKRYESTPGYREVVRIKQRYRNNIKSKLNQNLSGNKLKEFKIKQLLKSAKKYLRNRNFIVPISTIRQNARRSLKLKSLIKSWIEANYSFSKTPCVFLNFNNEYGFHWTTYGEKMSNSTYNIKRRMRRAV